MKAETCFICGKTLPNRWAVARREIVDGTERCYCALHASGDRKTAAKRYGKPHERDEMKPNENHTEENEARERALARKAGAEAAQKAWAACAGLAGKATAGLKSLWAKIHPDRSPEAMVDSLNRSLETNRARLAALKPELEKAYAEIVSKKAAWQKAPEVRKRLLKTELETLLARYKGLEREFSVLNENTRVAEAVKGRYLEVLAYEMRGSLGEDQVDDLSGLVDEKAEEADGVRDALADLEKAGRRKEHDAGSLEDELAGFDGELGLEETFENETTQTETLDENETLDGGAGLDGLADRECER